MVNLNFSSHKNIQFNSASLLPLDNFSSFALDVNLILVRKGKEALELISFTYNEVGKTM